MNITELTFRKATDADMDYLLWLREVTMNEHILSSGLPITTENHLDRIKYQFDNARIILHNDSKIGLVKTVEHSTHTEIVQIQIDPSQQGKGMGQKILRSVITKSKDRHLPVVLSVLKKNNAINLYRRMGFQTVDETDTSYIMRIAAL